MDDAGLESPLESVFALRKISEEPGKRANTTCHSPWTRLRDDFHRIMVLKQVHPTSDDVMGQSFLRFPDDSFLRRAFQTLLQRFVKRHVVFARTRIPYYPLTINEHYGGQ